MTNENFRRLPADNPRLLAFEFTGQISRQGVEQMADIVKSYFDADETVNILLILRRYEGLEAGAVFDLKGLSTQMRSARYVDRYAVVGAPAWIEAIIGLFEPISPVEAKTFSLADEDKAWLWAGDTTGADTSSSDQAT